MAQTLTRTFNLINSNNQNHDESSIVSSKISSSNDSSITEHHPIRRDNRYTKHSKSIRINDNITSLKRRVRKQQLQYERNQMTTLEEITFQLPSSTNLFLISYPQQSLSPCYYRTKKSSCVVPLPPLINETKTVRTGVQGIRLNLYGY